MSLNKLSHLASIILMITSSSIQALELGRYQQHQSGRVAGNIIVSLEPAEQELYVLIRGIEDYALESDPKGVKIVIRNAQDDIDHFSVIAKYGAKEVSRAYSVKSTQMLADRYAVKKGEAITNVAENLRTVLGGSFKQRVVALIRTNPNAFIDGDINQLKEAITLVIPSPKDVNGIEQAAAAREYRRISLQGSEPMIGLMIGGISTNVIAPKAKVLTPKSVPKKLPQLVQDPVMAQLDDSIEKIQKLIAQLQAHESGRSTTSEVTK